MTFKYHSTCITVQNAGIVSRMPSLLLSRCRLVDLREGSLVFPSLRQHRRNLTLFSMVNLFNSVSWLKWLAWTCLGKYQDPGRRPMMLWFMVSLLHPQGKIPVWISDCEHLCVISHINISQTRKHLKARGLYATRFLNYLLMLFYKPLRSFEYVHLQGNLINTASNNLKCSILWTPLPF